MALARCLDALAGQVEVALEVVVVDDGSADPERVERVAAAHEARLVRLPGLGPAAARNAGIRAATHDVVLLTDDDCVASPSWAPTLASAVGRTQALVAGLTTFDTRDPFVAASETIVAHAERAGDFAATRNVGLPRALALAVPFDERFREAGGEDREWCRRLAAAGAVLVRVDDAVLAHRPSLDLGAYWRQHLRYGRAARVDTAVGTPSSRDALALVRLGFSSGGRVGALVLLAQAATLLGYASRRQL
jgi:glycosyltransferase involved in cell wall biosynthesis